MIPSDYLQPETLGGYKIITNELMCDMRIHKRNWSERLFSWPWEPWKPTKMVKVPGNDIIVDEKTKRMVMHPETVKYLKQAYENEKNK